MDMYEEYLKLFKVFNLNNILIIMAVIAVISILVTYIKYKLNVSTMKKAVKEAIKELSIEAEAKHKKELGEGKDTVPKQ